MKTFSEAFITKANIKNIANANQDKGPRLSLDEIDFGKRTAEDAKKIQNVITNAGLWPESINNGNIWDFNFVKRVKWEIIYRIAGLGINAYALNYTLYDDNSFPVSENHILRFYPNCLVPCDRFKCNTYITQRNKNGGRKGIIMSEYLDKIATLFNCEYRELLYTCTQEVGLRGVFTEPDVHTITIGSRNYEIEYK